MLLSQFNGGLNTKIAPSHIANNESTVCINVDNSSVILKPIKGNTATAQNFGSDGSFTYFEGQWISGPLATTYVPFNNFLYYYKNGQLTKNTGVTELSVGIDKPTSTLTVTNLNLISVAFSDIIDVASDLEVGTYKYILMYFDADDNFSTITDEYAYTGTDGIRLTVTMPAGVARVAAFRLYENTYRFIGDLLASGTIDDTVMDIKAADAMSNIVLSTPIDIRQYCYTYYRSTDGAESAPSSLSTEVEILGNNARIESFTAPTDTSVTHIRLYRIGGVLTNFTLVAELAKTTTVYDDTIDDTTLAGADILSTSGTSTPPANLNYLTLYSATLFGATGTKVYFSQTGLVDLWSEFNYLELAEEITGFGATQNGLLIFLRNSTYILTGYTSENFTLHLLSNSQGCISNTSVQYAKNTLLWLSLDGVCASTGGDIQVITEIKLGKLNLEPIASAFYENQYYLFHSTGTLVIDFRFGTVFKELDLVANGAYYSSEFDKLYYIDPDDFGMYEFGTSATDVPYSYKTGRLFGNGLTVVKNYKNIYVYVSGTTDITVYLGKLDGTTAKIIDAQELTSGLNDVRLPSQADKGYFLQIQFDGTGEVHEIEFKSEGRQNGR